MTFLNEFILVLRWRPVLALQALYWFATKRRVRARNCLRMGAQASPFSYDMWLSFNERKTQALAFAPHAIGTWSHRPTFSVILYSAADTPIDQLQKSIQSVKQQCYADWELLLFASDHEPIPSGPGDPRIRVFDNRHTNSATQLSSGVAEANGEYVLPLMAGHLLSPLALFRYAEAIQSNPDAAMLFGDQDMFDRRGKRHSPWFKPLWNAEMILAQDYISAACLLESQAAKACLPLPEAFAGAAAFGLLLSASALGGKVTHIPHVLCHIPEETLSDDCAARLFIVSRHVAQQGAKALAGPFGSVVVSWPLPEPLPLVSIIVPTRDKVDLLKACIGSLLSLTAYPNFEVIIVDNCSVNKETLDYMAGFESDDRIRVIAYEKTYNFSAINNFAVEKANGTFVCLLNNDTEIIKADWLCQMMRQAVRPSVGATGAKLLYGDGTIQHAGVVVGMGQAAGHAHRFLRTDQPGYFGQAHIMRYSSAVTAACLVVEKRKFEFVGGLDANGLAIAFNDVDLCLKLEKAGWHNVYVPHAVLIHHESISRGNDLAPEHIERYMAELAVLQERWGTKDYVDPLHHPKLDRSCEEYVIRL